MDRPEAKNSIGKEMLRGLQHTLEAISRDSSANVMLLRSSVPRVFCAGADLKVRERLHFYYVLIVGVFTLLTYYTCFEHGHKSIKFVKYS